MSIRSKSRRVRNTAVNSVVKIPIASVMAKLLMAPEPCQNRMRATKSVVMLESKIAENALLKPMLTALARDLPLFSSSRIRS